MEGCITGRDALYGEGIEGAAGNTTVRELCVRCLKAKLHWGKFKERKKQQQQKKRRKKQQQQKKKKQQ